MKNVSELGSADKREANPTSNKIFNILNIFDVQSSVLGPEEDRAGMEVEGLHSWAVLGCCDVILIRSSLNLRSTLGWTRLCMFVLRIKLCWRAHNLVRKTLVHVLE